eukprot:496502-Pyramimonas_sp.AAC.2
MTDIVSLFHRELLSWLEKIDADATAFATAKVGTTVGRWPVYVTVCGGEKDAADFILSLEIGRLVRSFVAPSNPRNTFRDALLPHVGYRVVFPSTWLR